MKDTLIYCHKLSQILIIYFLTCYEIKETLYQLSGLNISDPLIIKTNFVDELIQLRLLVLKSKYPQYY